MARLRPGRAPEARPEGPPRQRRSELIAWVLRPPARNRRPPSPSPPVGLAPPVGVCTSGRTEPRFGGESRGEGQIQQRGCRVFQKLGAACEAGGPGGAVLAPPSALCPPGRTQAFQAPPALPHRPERPATQASGMASVPPRSRAGRPFKKTTLLLV